MKVNVASAVKNIVNWAFPLFFLGGLLYLVYDDYRDNGTATEEQLLMISHEIPCAGEDFRTALRNSPGPLTLQPFAMRRKLPLNVTRNINNLTH
ncbi:MAG: hypothetical protein E7D34_29750 [Klebsiella sp.]|nr:hypothetical protein [Klebsiella sp.]